MELFPPGAGTWIEGQVKRVLWASADTGYAVLRVETGAGEVTVVGTLASVAEAAESGGPPPFVTLEGRWEDHHTHGRQFRAVGFLEGMPRSLEGIKLYLGTGGIPGIGPKLAERIVDAFGLETPRVLSDEPQRLTSVKGIKAEKAKAISARWNQDADGRALTILLRGLGLPARLSERIRKRFGERTPHVLKHEPYRLAEEIAGIGFRTADQLARKLGIPPEDPGRARAAVQYVLEEARMEGHEYLTRADVARALAELDVPVDRVDAGIADAEGTGRVVISWTNEVFPVDPSPDDEIWTAQCWRDEADLAASIAGRSSDPQVDGDDGEVRAAEAVVGVVLHDRQREAVIAALHRPLVVITGGPGTGKTTLLRVLLAVLSRRGEADDWRLAAPTGRAAKRMEEATGRPASTLHRLLGVNPATGQFTDEIEAAGVIVDESSMLDLPLATALFRATTAPLVLVGDADQLPSVGPGQILRDVIESGACPVIRLERTFRQVEGSGILDAAYHVLHGQPPSDAGFTDYYVLARDDPDRARETVVEVAANRLPARGFAEVQVLAPTRKGPLGTEALNLALQARLNPRGEEVKRGERAFRLGDRVICTRNRYDVDVFNGDLGVVDGHDAAGLLVRFDGRIVPWAWDDWPSLELAYAITVHKSQGSEYPAVVLVIHPSHHVMLQRNLLYTAITRARRFLCIVGSPRAIDRAVRTATPRRNTRLSRRIKE